MEKYIIPGFILLFIIAFFVQMMIFISRYKKCPPDRIMVIYGKTPGQKAARCLHGGAAFILPVVQDYGFLSIRPINLELSMKKVYCKGSEMVDFEIKALILISTEPEYMQNAAMRLFGLNLEAIDELANGIFNNVLRSYTATIQLDKIKLDLGQFTSDLREKCEVELKKVGFTINSLCIEKLT